VGLWDSFLGGGRWVLMWLGLGGGEWCGGRGLVGWSMFFFEGFGIGGIWGACFCAVLIFL